jgi:hypothetical protein
MLFLGHEVLGESLGVLDRRADHTETTQALFQTIPVQRITAEHVRNGPTGDMQSPQEQRMVNVLSTPRHRRHDKGGGDRKDRTALIQTNTATQKLLFDRGLCKAETRLAPGKRVRKQCGTFLVEFLKPVFGRGSIREKTVICGLSQG